MISVALYSRALGIGLAVAFLAGCATQSEQGALPMSNATAQGEGHGRSWMLPEAKSKTLIYATGGCGGTCVMQYPGGEVVGSLDTMGGADCSDTRGNVFISSDATVVEYSHGGSAPINTLNVPGTLALGCAVDPTTGNLAVVFRGGSGSNLAVFPNAQGSPSLYDSKILDATFCGYDNVGNLFIDGFNQQSSELSELYAGSSGITELTINGTVGRPGQMQWDGAHMTYESTRKDAVNVARLQIAGTTATVIGKTHFRGLKGDASQSWIWENLIFVPFGVHSQQPNIGVWKYPRGGKALEKYTHFQETSIQGVTISVKV